MRTPFLLTALLGLAACDQALLGEEDPIMCTAHIQRGIEIRVEDARTGQPIAGGVRAAAWDFSYADSLRVVGYDDVLAQVPSVIGGVPERAGVYRVELEKAGYADWDSAGVVVRDAPCHVVPARFTVKLRPLP